LNSWNKWSFRLKWLSLSAFITIICVMAGGFITRELTERERDLQLRMGPHAHHFNVIKSLVETGKLSPKEAFLIVEGDSAERSSPDLAYLVDENEAIIAQNKSSKQHPDFNREHKFPLTKDLSVIYLKRHWKPRNHGLREHSSGTRLIGIVAIMVSISIGIALSILFFMLFVRKKSRQAEEVLSRLKSGDLKARFKVSDTDETSLLMIRFNDMADQIESLVTNLRNTEQARMMMLQELAHDLRTPVASLKQFQEILLHKGHLLDDEKRQQTQLLALKEIHYFERLVEDLLFLSGVNDPKYSASFRDVDLSVLIDEEVDSFPNESLKILCDLQEDLVIKGDSHLLKRLLRNALSNASKHASSTIKVNCRRDESTVVIDVVDDGSGMKEEDLKIFGEKKFSRQVDSNISIGLGSVIMKKIVSLHDGSLEVCNQNPGLRLRLILPLR
jgi:signal transduction histidine kinase